MENKYELLEMEIIEFENEDIIVTSNPEFPGGTDQGPIT